MVQDYKEVEDIHGMFKLTSNTGFPTWKTWLTKKEDIKF